MHKASLPRELLDSIRERRGRRHAFGTVEPAKTALLVIDMQNHFMAPGALAEVETARGIVPNINRIAEALREAGGHVIWIRVSFAGEQAGDQGWSHYLDHFAHPDRREAYRDALTPGAEAFDLWPALDVREGDRIVDKNRFSAFIQGSSDTDAVLKELGADMVIVTGTLTNVCCESTVRDAMMLDYKAIMVEDANAARTDEDHVAGLRTVAQVFGDIMTTDEVIAAIRGQTAEAAAAAE